MTMMVLRASLPTRARRARRLLLWLLAAFALGQVALGLAVDGCWPGVRDPEFEAKLQRLRQCRVEAPGRPLVLVLGSSRTVHGLDARRLSSPEQGGAVVFNLGLAGGGPLLHSVCLRRLLDEGIRPDLVFLEIMPAMVLDHPPGLWEEKLLDGARLRGDELAWLWPHYHQPRRLLGGWLLGRLLPCYRHQAELRGCLGLDSTAFNVPAIDSHGWLPRPGPADPERRRQGWELARGQYQRFCDASGLAGNLVEVLQDVLGLCRREGIGAHLFLMPEGQPFRALYSPAARAALAGLLDRLKRRWGVRVVDARDWVDDDGFWDMHHLLAGGARLFTDRFGREGLRPALAELSGGEHLAGVAAGR
jgi:hypothetical protein